ncbi:MAG: type II toxin-antitoxin system RelE/ParE family toxin [Myxococcaceae bacterium]
MLIVPKPRQVQELEIDGEKPFAKWFKKLKNVQAKAAILTRITKISTVGSFGTYEYLTGGVFELKFDIGPGYRVYFGLDNDVFVLIILGGDKSSQDRDIKKAKTLWQMYLEEGATHGTNPKK